MFLIKVTENLVCNTSLDQPSLVTSDRTSLSPASITKWTCWNVTTEKEISEMFDFQLRISTDDSPRKHADLSQQYSGDRGATIQVIDSASPKISISYGENTGILEKTIEKALFIKEYESSQEILRLKFEILAQNQELEKARDRNAVLEKKTEKLEEKIKMKRQKLEDIKKKVKDLEQKMGTTEQSKNVELWKAREKEQELMRDLDKLKSDQLNAQNEMIEQNKKIRKIERKRRSQRQKILDLEEEIELQRKTREELMQAREMVEFHEKTIEKLTGEIREGQDMIRKMEEQNDEKKKEIERLELENAVNSRKIEMLEKEKKARGAQKQKEQQQQIRDIEIIAIEEENEEQNEEQKKEVQLKLENVKIDNKDRPRLDVKNFTQQLWSAFLKKKTIIITSIVTSIIIGLVIGLVIGLKPKPENPTTISSTTTSATTTFFTTTPYTSIGTSTTTAASTTSTTTREKTTTTTTTTKTSSITSITTTTTNTTNTSSTYTTTSKTTSTTSTSNKTTSTTTTTKTTSTTSSTTTKTTFTSSTSSTTTPKTTSTTFTSTTTTETTTTTSRTTTGMFFKLLKLSFTIILLGILITGGQNKSGRLSSAEVFIPGLNESCSLSNMTQSRFRHTQNDFLSCGGDEGKGNKCEVYSPQRGNWRIESYSLHYERHGHTSWSLNESVVLLGGWYSNSTTEIIHGNGTLSRGFDLKHQRM